MGVVAQRSVVGVAPVLLRLGAWNWGGEAI